VSGPKRKRETDPNAKLRLVFQTCPAKCFRCNACGYFWGPDNEKWDGQPATWSGRGNAGGVGRVGVP